MTAEILVAVAILATSFLDALRDGWRDNARYHKGTAWDVWHIVKRAQLYLPIVVLMVLVGYSWPWWVGLILGGLIVWRVGIEVAGKGSWPSTWMFWK